jgi:hypothetical protein
MKKVIKLTESDLVRIVKRVISEQTKDGPVIPKNAKLEIESSVINDFKKMGIEFKKSETPDTFLEKLNKSNVGINAFHISTEGWKFPIQPVFVNIPLENSNVRLSFEPFNKERGIYMFKVTKHL